MITLFKPMSDRSNLRGGGINHRLNGVTAEGKRIKYNPSQIRSLLGSIVDDDILLCSASDGIMMLKEAHRPPGVNKQGIVRDWVASFHACMSSICHSQAVKDFCTPGTKKTSNIIYNISFTHITFLCVLQISKRCKTDTPSRFPLSILPLSCLKLR